MNCARLRDFSLVCTGQINLPSIYALTADVIKISARPINNVRPLHACFAIAYPRQESASAAATVLMEIDKKKYLKIMAIIMY